MTPTLTPEQLIAEARKPLVEPTGKGEQHCRWCNRMSYIGDGVDVQHHQWCPSHLVLSLADALASAQQQNEELAKAVTQMSREVRSLTTRYEQRIKKEQTHTRMFAKAADNEKAEAKQMREERNEFRALATRYEQRLQSYEARIADLCDAHEEAHIRADTAEQRGQEPT